MYQRIRPATALTTVLILAGSSLPALAQDCVGLPAGRGLLSVGFEGTDGATGQGVGFAYQTRGAAVLLEHRSLDDISLADERTTTGMQASVKVPAVRLPICVVAGVQSTSYDDTFHESTSWTGHDPGYRVERHRMGGLYHSLRVPVGVSIGREFQIGERFSVIPFIQPSVVFDTESYRPHSGGEQSRSAWGIGGSGGVTAAFDWFVLRSAISHAATHEYALSMQHNWPVVSLHAGVRF